MANPNPRLVAAIRRAPAHLRPILLATALVESGGRLDAVGDSGNSHGAYQMNVRGRGAGWTIPNMRDPDRSTQAAVREFQTFYGRGARGADLAYRAQRPADRAGYMRKINQYLPEARRILGLPAPTPPVAAAAASPVAQDGSVTVPDNGTINLAAALGLFDKQAEAALRGEAPSAGYVNEMLALVQQGKVRATPQALPGVGPLVRPRPGATQTIPPPTVSADVVPSGGWGGTQGALEGLVKPVIDRHGLVVTSSKRDRRNTASGGVSDHWSGSTNSYAWDVGWNGSMPTPAADRAASNIVRALGGPKNWGLRGGNFTTTRNGIRWQVLYRTNIGGNHYNHIHIGARRV